MVSEAILRYFLDFYLIIWKKDSFGKVSICTGREYTGQVGQGFYPMKHPFRGTGFIRQAG